MLFEYQPDCVDFRISGKVSISGSEYTEADATDRTRSAGGTTSGKNPEALESSASIGRDIASARNLFVVGDKAVGRWSASISSRILESASKRLR